MRFTIIVPSDDFHELWSKGQDLSPSVEPEEISWEQKVLAIGHFRPVVSEEPWRRRCHMNGQQLDHPKWRYTYVQHRACQQVR